MDTTDTMQDTTAKLTGSSDVKDNIRLAIGAAAAGAAIFAPLSYSWKGVLTAVAAESILAGVYGYTPLKKLFAF
jgi:hypothetical protein